MTDIVQKIEVLIDQLEAAAPARESLEWYLLNNLRDYRRTLQSGSSPLEIGNATRALVRFCTESMDWSSPLYKSCMEITALGGKLAKS